MQISVVVPAYNEAHRIRATIEKIIEFCTRELSQWEVIVVDDGSSGDTEGALRGLKGVRCLRNERNRGKGYSVRRGMLEARFDPVLFTDADLSTPIEDALALHRAIENGADVAIGSRLPDPSKQVRRTALRKLMAVVFRLLVKVIAIRGFHDTQCGFKMFRRAAARDLFAAQKLERWGFDVEILYLARRKKLKIVEVPVSYRESPESRLSFLTPLAMVRDLLQIRLHAIRGRYR
jgi:glycosyltransferase involved in cell wall biosynthesis